MRWRSVVRRRPQGDLGMLELEWLLTDCLTMSVQSGAIENSGFCNSHLGSSFIGGAMAPPI